MNIQRLIDEKDHKELYKNLDKLSTHNAVIVNINIGNYEAALKLAKEKSFEQAYIYYKMHEYKKSAGICKLIMKERRNCNVNVYLLLFQNYYFLQKFQSAISILQKIGTYDDEMLCNLSACYGLFLSTVNRDKCFYYTMGLKEKSSDVEKVKGIFNSIAEKYKFKSDQTKEEFDYNLKFQYLNQEPKYLEVLSNSGPSSWRQLVNLKGLDLSKEKLSKNQTESSQINPTEENNQVNFSRPFFWQNNFTRKYKNFTLGGFYKKNDFSIVKYLNLSQEESIFKVYLLLRKGRVSKVKGIAKEIRNEKLRNALLFLSERNGDLNSIHLFLNN